MEQSGIKEILNALQLHSEHMDKKLTDALQLHSEHMDKKLDKVKGELETKMDAGFDRLGKKVDGLRIDLTETQETVDFLSSKSVQHERKLRKVSEQI
ncbi:hypothetical protein NC797_02540 [Aquibacillus sp. 3ASR75-11]|uniref:Uncharacterized protein n=1 Tax=Terrihalobacillus insolitus TaxID=2950438 RepID=A0A9X4AL08_9BACI|nr:hypothetical protein [Terrihalobacillus insolitus]MDC3411929.1 hypothetical protein [Terrihalobacillus insolitus]MDC3423384.1 hypothetical protein [Terrihalobacillus insolitus]